MPNSLPMNFTWAITLHFATLLALPFLLMSIASMPRRGLWSAKKKQSAVKRHPLPGDIHGVTRRAQTSSRYGSRRAICVYARCAGPGPTWAQADRGLTPNAASLGCSVSSSAEQSFADAVR
jgi:hypothetical protein